MVRPCPLFGTSTALTGGTVVTVACRKLRNIEANALRLVLRTPHYATVEVNDECCLGVSISISWGPRFSQNSLSCFKPVVGPMTGKIATVDVQLSNRAMSLNFGAKDVGGMVLWLVCRSNRGGED